MSVADADVVVVVDAVVAVAAVVVVVVVVAWRVREELLIASRIEQSE